MQIMIDELVAEVMRVLEVQLPYYYYYHSPKHTRYVMEKAIEIADFENINGEDKELLRIAALFHDIGFIQDSKDHEKISCTIARRILKNRGFREVEIRKIEGMIMATKIPQNPKTKLEAIVADADLEYLGTDHFKSVSELLFKERKYFNPDLSRKEWNSVQYSFMEAHNYHTDYCKKFKEPVKSENIQNYLI